MSDPHHKFDAQRLLALAREARSFDDLIARTESTESARPLRARIAWRWVGPFAAAALLALAATAWIVAPRGHEAERERHPQFPDLLPPIVITTPERTVNMVVALYRSDKRTNERCAECWCVARWDADWGDGRTVNELEHDELVSGSVARSCVGDPQRVVVIGLSGPASAMPRTDQQALDLSLCLMGEVDHTPSASTLTACVPKGLDYCMADWNR